MTNREALAWLLVGLLLGVLIGMLIAKGNRPAPTGNPTPPRKTKTQPIRIVEKPA